MVRSLFVVIGAVAAALASAVIILVPALISGDPNYSAKMQDQHSPPQQISPSVRSPPSSLTHDAQTMHSTTTYTVPKDITAWVILIVNEAHEDWPLEQHKFISDMNSQFLPQNLILHSGQAVAFFNADGPWDFHHSHVIIISDSTDGKEVWRTETLGYPFFNKGPSMSSVKVLPPGNYIIAMLTNGDPTPIKSATITVLEEPMESTSSSSSTSGVSKVAGAFYTSQEAVVNPKDNDGGMHYGNLAYYKTEMARHGWQIVSFFNFDFASCSYYGKTGPNCLTGGSSASSAYWGDNKTPSHSLFIWRVEGKELSDVSKDMEAFVRDNVYT